MTMKKMHRKIEVVIMVVGLLSSLSGCKTSEKTEASIPVIAGTNIVQTATVTDTSTLLGTEWERDMESLTISKDGKVHYEQLFGRDENGNLRVDASGAPLIGQMWDGFIDGIYIVNSDQTAMNYQQDFDAYSVISITFLGETRTHNVSSTLITYVGEKCLILDNKRTWLKK